jgi:calcineurin-like phosphoesterase family protein
MTKKSYAAFLTIAIALFIAVSAIPAISQDKAADTTDILREKLRSDKKLVIADAMKLTESEAKGFWPVYDAYQKELGALGDRFVKLVGNYSKTYKTMSDEDAKKMLDNYLTFEEDELKLVKSYLPKFREVLSEKRVAQYYQLENKIKMIIYYEFVKVVPLMEGK